MDDLDLQQALGELTYHFMHEVPHNVALGLTIRDMAEGEVKMALPYSDQLVGNPDSGILHGGAITTLMDTCCGAAVFLKMKSRITIATLDLRIDYLKPATPREEVVAHATCYKATRNVAFASCSAYHDDPDDPIAHATGTFMLHTKSGSSK